MFRAFADKTKSDQRALAACIQSSHTLVTPDDLRHLDMPTLVAVGMRDDIAGSPDALADMLPNGQALHIENRDHQLAVGDRQFKAGVLGFLRTICRHERYGVVPENGRGNKFHRRAQ